MDLLLKNKKVLVVDDEQLILDIVKSIVSSCSGEADSRPNAQNIIGIIKNFNYDLLILDRYMPEHDGIDVLKAIKNDPYIKHTPVIMLTGESEKKEIIKCVQAGANGYVIKPFKPRDLISQIARIFKNNESANEGFEVDL